MPIANAYKVCKEEKEGEGGRSTKVREKLDPPHSPPHNQGSLPSKHPTHQDGEGECQASLHGAMGGRVQAYKGAKGGGRAWGDEGAHQVVGSWARRPNIDLDPLRYLPKHGELGLATTTNGFSMGALP